jgi:hypothetical protein
MRDGCINFATGPGKKGLEKMTKPPPGHPVIHDIDEPRLQRTGWVERSDTHRVRHFGKQLFYAPQVMCFASAQAILRAIVHVLESHQP